MVFRRRCKRRTACIKHTCPMIIPISVSINTFAQENRIVIGPGFSPKSVTFLTVLITIGIGTWQNMNVQSICEIVHVIVQKTVNNVGGHCWGNPFSIRPFTNCILNQFYESLGKKLVKYESCYGLVWSAMVWSFLFWHCSAMNTPKSCLSDKCP